MLDADTRSPMTLLLLQLLLLMVEVNSFKLRHLQQRQFGVGYECHVTRVDQVS